MKQDAIKDLISGTLITVFFGGMAALCFVKGWTDDIFALGCLAFLSLMGLTIIVSAIYDLHYVKWLKKHFNDMKELDRRKAEAEKALAKAQEEAKLISHNSIE